MPTLYFEIRTNAIVYEPKRLFADGEAKPNFKMGKYFCRAAGFASFLHSYFRKTLAYDRYTSFLPSFKSRQPVIERIEHSSGPRAWKKALAHAATFSRRKCDNRRPRHDSIESILICEGLISAVQSELVSHTGNPARNRLSSCDFSRVVREIRLP